MPFYLSSQYDAMFPCCSLSDEDMGLFLTRSYYSSHRLVLQKEDNLSAAKNSTSPDLMAPIDICPRRLIDTHTLEFVEFIETETTPPYAILSHRWMSGEEVIHEEFAQPREEISSKLGYQKIQSACRQARQDGLRYIWIDTCCIEQTNHGDVSANITSMYAYYQNAVVCYAHLVDIREKKDTSRHFRTEWFHRGWTLQELLAPRTVIFFNRYWERIGDKHELRDVIHRKTTIPPSVLSGEQAIQDIDVLTRMSWAMGRTTTKQQDEAYCLQGLLGISVQPNYAEKQGASFNRLGKALFDVYPDLKERLGINDDLFRYPNDLSFYRLLSIRFLDTRIKISGLNLDVNSRGRRERVEQITRAIFRKHSLDIR
ncbi:hypothetical protein VKT23_017289 [Stygiomarasmius scandens]|uniref:Heterokaryon incompatibility domain-containing protein n=1 Tax=Marasmiellus scandens TaxID=2682957 RepID=A0ABR1ISJ3_9AGAR